MSPCLFGSAFGSVPFYIFPSVLSPYVLAMLNVLEVIGVLHTSYMIRDADLIFPRYRAKSSCLAIPGCCRCVISAFASKPERNNGGIVT